MTVKELIDRLSLLNEEKEVIINFARYENASENWSEDFESVDLVWENAKNKVVLESAETRQRILNTEADSIVSQRSWERFREKIKIMRGEKHDS